jgi:hypothetical protein
MSEMQAEAMRVEITWQKALSQWHGEDWATVESREPDGRCSYASWRGREKRTSLPCDLKFPPDRCVSA